MELIKFINLAITPYSECNSNYNNYSIKKLFFNLFCNRAKRIFITYKIIFLANATKKLFITDVTKKIFIADITTNITKEILFTLNCREYICKN